MKILYPEFKNRIKYSWIILFLFLGFIAYLLDPGIYYLMKEIKNPAMDSIMTFFTFLGELEVYIFISLILVIYFTYKKKEYILPYFLGGVIFTSLSILLLKLIILRPRPDGLYFVETSFSSFPSGHTAMMFFLIPFFEKEYLEKNNKHLTSKNILNKLFSGWNNLYIYVVAIAILVSFSRIYLGVHYLSDVFFGALIGYSLGWYFANIK